MFNFDDEPDQESGSKKLKAQLERSAKAFRTIPDCR